jgi:hypothetical protein
LLAVAEVAAVTLSNTALAAVALGGYVHLLRVQVEVGLLNLR